MAGVKRHVKVTLDGPRSEVVHDFVVQYEVCLKTPTFKSIELETSQLLAIG